MPKFMQGDRVRYLRGGHTKEYSQKEAYIDGIKVFASEETGRPIYYIKWAEDEGRFEYGIHEKNLELIKRKDPDWEV